MFVTESSNIQQVWIALMQRLLHDPDHETNPRGYPTREITGVVFRITDLRNNIISHPVRNLNYKFMVAEWLWIALGLEDLETLTKYNGQMSRFSDDGKILAGAYGPRLATQWSYVVDTLKRESVSRQAVATIWTPNPSRSKDIPCTISLQFLLRDGKLNVIVTMRSSDVWLGIPYDVFTFSQLANSIAGILGVEPGYLQMQLGSSHVYADHFEKVQQVLNTFQTTEGLRSPLLPAWPDYHLEEVLKDPIDYPKMAFWNAPWGAYARVLRAATWSEAQSILAER
jgi:thymidylate synthase